LKFIPIKNKIGGAQSLAGGEISEPMYAENITPRTKQTECHISFPFLLCPFIRIAAGHNEILV